MAGRIKRPCASPGCAALVEGGYCEKCHRDKPSKLAERTRLSSSVRGYGKRWQAMSAARLNKHPFCADPFKIHSPFPGPATLTDHIVPHKGDMALFWNPKNWQSLCSSCHSRKTALEDGGFGHAMKKMSVTLVCGPPGAGKSTYVNQQRLEGDIVWDFDAVLMTVTGLDSHERSERSKSLIGFIFAMRDGLFREVLRSGQGKRVWIIESCPLAADRERFVRDFAARVVLLDTEESICRERMRGRGEGWDKPLADWWSQFRSDRGRAGSNL